MTPGFISDVSKVCNYVSEADLMMIIMTMMMTKKTTWPIWPLPTGSALSSPIVIWNISSQSITNLCHLEL